MNQYAKNKNARVAFTYAGGLFCSPVVFEFEGKNGTNSNRRTRFEKQAGLIMPELRQISQHSTCYKSARRLLSIIFLEQSKHD